MCGFFDKEIRPLKENNTNKIVLYIYYSKFGDKTTQKNELKKLEMNTVKLLNAYERYKYPGLKRNTIITNLKLNSRIKFVEVK